MSEVKKPAPCLYHGVMVSSTFTDLVHHRSILMDALQKEELFPIGMEDYVPSPEDDVISSSFKMVSKSSAYIGLISHRYGQIIQCSKRNPLDYSITHLEFEKAKQLDRPTLIFIMGEDHPVKKNDIEIDPEKIRKLEVFRETAKKGRIYIDFNSIEEFTSKAIHAVANLRRHIEEKGTICTQPEIKSDPSATAKTKSDPIPIPPNFYAEPPYIGSHKFVGRQAQLETLSDWATPSDSHCVLLFEAIGGTGKSMLTWEWATKHSAQIRTDWAGRFWYSFYEKGATMVDFCRRVLAYITGQPHSDFKERNTAELTKLLIHHLQDRPWLIILDGLERILISYHRFDAAQILDEEAGNDDKIARRDPCAAINPEDDDLLRALSGSHPSKILLTSRLIPRVLLNQSNQPIPGVLREHLPGLRPADAESLIRGCGITGVSQNIQNYLKKHCDCHPLVIGVLAGLINDYLPNRGNFDDWAADPMGGGELNLAELDLVQKRNHILNAAIAALSEASLQLLSILALLSNSIDYNTLCALNPYISPIPEEVAIPKNIEHGVKWEKKSNAKKAALHKDYLDAIYRREEYEVALVRREEEKQRNTKNLMDTVKDLERRGLLQYDAISKRHDLHPVVRGISAGGLKREEKNIYGQRVVDHFSQQAQDPYDQAETLEDFDKARHIVKVLFQMGKMEEARDFISKNHTFLKTLSHRFEAHNEILTIIRPFFPVGWNEMPDYLIKSGGLSLANIAAIALRRIGAFQEAADISSTAIHISLKKINVEFSLVSQLLNLASTVGEQNCLAQEDRLLDLVNDVLIGSLDANHLSSYRLARFRQLSKLAKWSDAEAIWSELVNNELSIQARPIAAHHFAVHLYLRGQLTEGELVKAEKLNQTSQSAIGKRNLCALRGYWQLQQKDFESAKKSLQDAVALAHKAGKVDRRSEICLAIAKNNQKELLEPNQVAEQLAYSIDENCHYDLANLWFAIGNREQAKTHGLAAYKWAWADGIPYSRGYELNLARKLLQELDVEIPILNPYDSSKDEKTPLELEVVNTIEKIQVERSKWKLSLEETFGKD